MRCTFCGQLLQDTVRKCPICGQELEPQTEQEVLDEVQQPEQQAEIFGHTQETIRPSEIRPDMPMKWYKFLIYVSLIISTVVNIASGFDCLRGAQYGDASIAQEVYEKYAAMQIVDIGYGVLAIALGVFCFICRQRLAGYKKNGPKSLLRLYVLTTLLTLVYTTAVMVVTGMDMMTMDIILNVVLSLFMIYWNRIYFKKRMHLFIR